MRAAVRGSVGALCALLPAIATPALAGAAQPAQAGGQPAELSLALAGRATATPGRDVTYTLTIRNGGPGTARAATVDDQLPDGVAFVSVSASSGACSGGQSVQCALGDLAPGASRHVTLVARAVRIGTQTDTAVARSQAPDPNNDDNSVSVTTQVHAPGPPFTGVALPLRRLALRHRVAAIRVLCPLATYGGCAGEVTLTAAAPRGTPPARDVRRGILKLGSARFTVAAGRARIVRVPLATNAIRLIRADARLSARATATAEDGDGTLQMTAARVTVMPAARGASQRRHGGRR